MMRWICDCFFCELDGCWWCLEIQYYPVHHTSMHRYCTLFFHFLDIAATNHFLPYKELCREKQEEPMTHITFLEGLAASLCGVKISAPPAKAKSANVPVAKSNLIQARWPCMNTMPVSTAGRSGRSVGVWHGPLSHCRLEVLWSMTHLTFWI